MPSNQSENDAANQVAMDNALESNDDANAKAEFVQRANSNPVNSGKFICVEIETLFEDFPISICCTFSRQLHGRPML